MSSVQRILDASLNRATEGLRVAEDYVRFVLDDGHLTELLKSLRHDLAAAAASLPFGERHAARDTAADVGTTIATAAEASRHDAWSVCQAALERTKQSLRSLEEFSKVALPAAAAEFESLRYRLYILEAAIGRTVDAIDRLAAAQLYVLVDGRESVGEFESLVRELLAGGADAIQLRDKSLDDRRLIERGRVLVKTLREKTTNSPDQAWSRLVQSAAPPPRPLAIINDRADVAAIVDADGVHLGQEDMTVKGARSIVAPRKLIGVSCHSIEQARRAVLDGANYIGVGPTFPSRTKQFEAFPGLELLRAVSAEIRLPAFAIGGIGQDNLPQVVEVGVTRIAVSSAAIDAQSPADAVRLLRAAVSSG